MKFIESVSKKDYDDFLLKTDNPHFLQSYAWGEFSAISKNYTAHYVGLEKNKKLVAVALLLEKKMPLGFSYFYSPKGFAINYNDYDLLSVFTEKIKEYCKKYKAIFIKIDPEIIISVNEELFDNEKQINNIKKVGFKHKGYTKDFKSSFQPRYTFQIDLTKEWDLIYDGFSKTTKERIKKSDNVEFVIGTKKDLDKFYELIYITEQRKGFISYGEDYYKKLYDVYYNGQIKLCFGVFNIVGEIIDTEKRIDKLEKTISLINNNEKSKNEHIKRKITAQKELKEYKELKKEHGNTLILSAYYMISFGDTCWTLYAGNHDLLNKKNAAFKVYPGFLKYFKEQGLKTCDQFGSPSGEEKDTSIYGLYEFKKRFGGDFVEFVGEFDLILNKIMYFVFNKIIPIYRFIVKKIRVSKSRIK